VAFIGFEIKAEIVSWHDLGGLRSSRKYGSNFVGGIALYTEFVPTLTSPRFIVMPLTEYGLPNLGFHFLTSVKVTRENPPQSSTRTSSVETNLEP